MRFGFAFGLLLVSTLPVRSADAESKTPYVWRVVLQSQVHPALSIPVRERLCKDLKAALQPGVGGDLGRVEVIDLRAEPEKNWEPLWKEFVDGGWPALEKPEGQKLTGLKTHFVKVTVRDGRTFRVETRQLDGSTGIVSALVRSTETKNVDTLARLTGLLIGKDFGPVGTVESIKDDEKQVSVKFRGGQLPGFEGKVQMGDILAFGMVAEVPRPNSGNKPKSELPPQLMGKPQPATYLRVISKISNGECRCEIISRLKDPFVKVKNLVGYRAMKLATQEATVRVRLVDKDGKAPPSTTSLEIWATDTGFTGKPTVHDTLEFRNGLYTSGKSLKHVACVVVRVGSSKNEPHVMPVVPGNEPITLRVNIKKEEIEIAEFEQACERFRARVADAGMAQVELFKALGKLITDGDHKEALTRATKGSKATETADLILSDELAKLKKDKLVKEVYPSSVLSRSEEQLKILRTAKPVLEKRIEDLKSVIDKVNDPVKFEKEFRANELVRQIQYHVGRGEVPEAEPLYDQLIELTKQDAVKAKKAQLVAEWATANDEHKKARAFLLDEWRKATVLAEYQPLFAKLQPTADTLVKHTDKLGLRNLMSAIGITYARLQDQLAPLDENADADRMLIKDLKAFADEVRKVEQVAEAELKKLDEKK